MEMDMDGVDAAAERKAAAAALRWKAPAAMVLVQLFLMGMVLLCKEAISGGMFIFALVAYRGFFGAAFVLPFALIFERGKWKDMNWRVCGWIFLNAIIGFAVPMSLYNYGLMDTTASYAVIFLNIIPLVTFILSIICRMESLQFGTTTGSLKIVGVLLSVGGTMLISLYKGKTLHLWNSILHHHKEEQIQNASHQLRGTILLLGSSFAFSCWYLIQYPYKYWSSMATCLFGGLQTGIVGVILRRDRSAWKLGWDIQLLAVLYTGAFATAGRYSLSSWVIAKKGPAYPTTFSPLSLVFTVLLDSILLAGDIRVGSLLGTTTVIAGLYIFLCATRKELARK
ncbi:hypothetical protein ACP70R_021263 [Stipagrostis hirtigluma subsp. patula]